MRIHRTHFLWGWLFFLAFVIYGSLTPFEFRVPPRDFSEVVFRFWAAHRYGTEIIRNILFYLPLGFYTGALQLQKRVSVARTVMLTILFSLLLSLTLEILQAYSPPRDSTLSDSLLNTLGGGIGALLAVLSFRPVYFHSHKIWTHLTRERPLLLFAMLYALIILLGGLLPLDISIYPKHIAASWKAARWIPFSFSGITLFEAFHLLKDFLIFGSFALYLHFVAQFYRLRLASFLWIVLLTTLLSTFIEFSQLIVMSRITDMTDIVIAFFGAVSAKLLADKNEKDAPLHKRQGIYTIVYLAAAATILLLPAPFEISWASKVGKIKFFSCFSSFPNIFKLQSLFLTALTFIPLGIFLYARFNHKSSGRLQAFAASFLISALLAAYYAMQGRMLAASVVLLAALLSSIIGIRAGVRLERIHPHIL